MKRTGSIVLTLALIGSSAFAHEANRQDLARAQASGERLSRIDRLTLRSKVVLAYVVRGQIRANQRVMDTLGVEHRPTAATITLGLGSAAGEVLIGASAAKILKTHHFGQLDREVSYAYKRLSEEQDAIKALRLEATNLEAEVGAPTAQAGLEVATLEGAPQVATFSSAADRLRSVRGQIAAREMQVAEYTRRAGASTGRLPWLGRLARPTRLVLGSLILPVALWDAGLTAYQVAYDPQHADELERQLSDFIDDARATLDAQ